MAQKNRKDYKLDIPNNNMNSNTNSIFVKITNCKVIKIKDKLFN